MNMHGWKPPWSTNSNKTRSPQPLPSGNGALPEALGPLSLLPGHVQGQPLRSFPSLSKSLVAGSLHT